MSGTSIRIDVDDSQVRQALNGIASRGENLQPAYENIAPMLLASTLDRFERGIDPDGKPWKPSQRAAREGGQTLVDKGHLRDSLTFSATAEYAEVGTNIIYAAIHQKSGYTGRNHAAFMPERAFLGIDGDDRAEIIHILRDHVAGGL